MSGTDKRRGGVSVRVSEETKALLKTYAQSKKIGMGVILDLVIPQVIEHDLYDPDWTEKLKAATATVELLARLGDECPGLAYGKGKGGDEDLVFRCVWFQDDGPPKIKLLGRTESLQESACASCDRTKKIVRGLQSRDDRIVELETSLKAKASEVFKAPVCNAGAILSRDGTQFKGCRRSRNVPVSIEGFCKVLRSGLPCYMYAEAVIGVGAR